MYTDIQKAFVSVSHQKLIKTLTQYRLHESLVNWFEEYPKKKRSQRVFVNNMLSNYLVVFSGIPQGGVIGTLLFVIYTSIILQHILIITVK